MESAYRKLFTNGIQSISFLFAIFETNYLLNTLDLGEKHHIFSHCMFGNEKVAISKRTQREKSMLDYNFIWNVFSFPLKIQGAAAHIVGYRRNVSAPQT